MIEVFDTFEAFEAAAVVDVVALNREFETADPKSILRWAVGQYGDRLAIVTSFQPTGIVTLHMLHELERECGVRVPVLTLDTGLLFPETYALIDQVEARFNLNLKRVRPTQSVAEQAFAHGETLWERNPDQCCNLRKVVPLDTALQGYRAWVSGVRRDQSGRGSARIISSQSAQSGRVKLLPFANWDERMIWTYIHAYELPYNTLHDQGYPSIGCAPSSCTQAVTAGGRDERAGRWANSNKTECGIHSGGMR